MKTPKSVMFLTYTLADLADLHFVEQRRAHLLALFLEHDATRDDDIAAALVQLDDLDIDRLVDQRVEIRHLAQRNLRAGQEGVDTHDIDHDTALDAAGDPTVDGLAGIVHFADPVPDAHEVGLLLGKQQLAVLVLDLLEDRHRSGRRP